MIGMQQSRSQGKTLIDQSTLQMNTQNGPNLELKLQETEMPDAT